MKRALAATLFVCVLVTMVFAFSFAQRRVPYLAVHHGVTDVEPTVAIATDQFPESPTKSPSLLTATERLGANRRAREEAGSPIDATDLARVSREIGKEPAYAGDERHYYLLILDDDEAKKLWIVFDGSTLYVDCNLNGDLTDDGEAYFPSEDDKQFGLRSIKKIAFRTESGEQGELTYVFPNSMLSDEEFVARIQIAWRSATYSAWGDQDGGVFDASVPAEAPILRINGPLEMGFETQAKFAIEATAENEFKISAGVGTPGLGVGSFVHLKYWKDGIPENVFPLAVLTFPPEDSENPAVRVKTHLTERC